MRVREALGLGAHVHCPALSLSSWGPRTSLWIVDLRACPRINMRAVPANKFQTSRNEQNTDTAQRRTTRQGCAALAHVCGLVSCESQPRYQHHEVDGHIGHGADAEMPIVIRSMDQRTSSHSRTTSH